MFLSAFLLFQVQPIIGRALLPWFGGGSSVWMTTLLFFQAALLLGYGYAHVIGRLAPRAQAAVHVALLLAAAVTLPIIPREALRPEDASRPALRLLIALAVTVGPTFVLLATTGPLLQRWFATANAGRSPYPLYAVSNAGSLLALLTYPVLVEPLSGLRAQSWAWSAGYVAFALACGALAWRSLRGARGLEAARAEAAPPEPRPGVGRMAAWVALPAVATMLLMATTNQVTQDIASVPLLWVLPLAIYLLTFILCFSSDRVYDGPLFSVLLVIALFYSVYLLQRPALGLGWHVLFSGSLVFFGCMSLHGETARLKPGPAHLTLFYLLVALGGAIGGAFVGLVAPVLFEGFWEYHVALWLTPALVLAAQFAGGRPDRRLVAGAAAGLLVLGGVLTAQVQQRSADVIFRERNFYGVVRVIERPSRSSEHVLRTLEHGRIVHGIQRQDPSHARAPLAYYTPDSGVGVTFAQLPPADEEEIRVGVIGLGAGVIASYAQPEEAWVFYEIDPLVTDVAESYFTYLRDARDRGTTVEVRHGDARLVMERELREGVPGRFDVLVVDAFSGDSVPTHLLTREAFEVYWQHLEPDGVLVVQVTNRHIDLTPVARGLAAERGHEALLVVDRTVEPDSYGSAWVLVTRDEAFLAAVEASVTPWQAHARTPRIWTDDRSDVFGLLVFN
ncbi:MAG: hypothetical protein AMXMBFR23_07100 [Chloroflexota bacterium]